MSTTNKLTIGLFGFGTVGEGIFQILEQSTAINAQIKKICIKHKDKPRHAPADLFTNDPNELLKDEEINVIVELINDSEEAYTIVTTALKNKKAVVSANKKLIATHLPELLALQKQYDTPFLYEASVCGSIPIIRNLEEYFDNDLLQSLSGVVNGSTNFILTKIFDEGLSYKEALLLAQASGFAEANPALDVEGTDAVNKLSILLTHAYGLIKHPDHILTNGITHIHAYDALYARQKGYQIKLVANARKLANGKIAAYVWPQFVTPFHQLYGIKNEYNGVILESSFSDKQFLYGKGAGRYPTASAVLSDISALRYNYRYEYRKLQAAEPVALSNDYYLRLFVSFDTASQVKKSDFEWIEESFQNENRQYLVGVIHIEKLKQAIWRSNKKVSSIICPNGIIENIDLRTIQMRSLELAGVVNGATELILN